MNAKNWSLDEMAQEVYVVPYSIDECEKRLEGLNQPLPRFYLGLFDSAYSSRTKVIRLVKHNPVNPDEMYCIQGVKKYQPRALFDYPRPSQYVHAEMNIALRPNATVTQVILYSPRRMTKAQKSEIIGTMVTILFITLIVEWIALDSGFDFIPVARFFLVITVLQLFGTFRHYSRARTKLRQQIVKTLALESDLKDNPL